MFQPKEPKFGFLEKARLWKLLRITPLATVTYDTRSGKYNVENGRKVHQTSVPGKSTTLTVISDDGHQFTVTRERGKGYSTEERLTWVTVETIPIF